MLPICVLAVAVLPSVLGALDHEVKSHECTQCDCFVIYDECDIWNPLQPYAVAKEPYTVSEDECLKKCRNDNRCDAAVWGIVGGYNWFTCELYRGANGGEVMPASDLGYVEPLNTFVKRKAMECMVPQNSKLQDFALDSSSAALQAVEDRKNNYARLASRRNPLFGRRRR